MRSRMKSVQARIRRMRQRLEREATPELPALFVGDTDDGAIDDGGRYGGGDDPRAVLLQQEAAEWRRRKLEDNYNA